MAAAVSKRQQARNERALQDITRTVPGNDRCADCNAPNPSWASWNLGIFLCIRCAALHRKLGTHISKVKSLSMDSWSVEQVDNMKKIGNANSNRQLNPRNISAKIPVDVDEVDAAIEKHIRQKYEQRAFSTEARSAPSTRQNTGSTATGSDEPPPLPPKPSKHWGFSSRSASSTLPRTKKHDYPEAPISSTIHVEEARGKRGLFGMRVTSVGNNFDQKLNMLKEMGFTNTKQNQDILKNANGSLDRAVEILSRLNESTPPQPEPLRATTPVSRTTTPGLKLTKTRSSQPDSAWEVKDSKRSATAPLPPLPTRSQSTEPVNNTWNPFLQPQQTQDLSASMQNMSIAQPPQPQQAYAQAPLTVQTTGNPWGLYMQPQQAMSVPAIPQQYQPSPLNTTNPFFQTASPQSFTSSNPWSQQMTPQTMTPTTPHSNPFGLPGLDAKQAQSVPQVLAQGSQAQYGVGSSTGPAQSYQYMAPQPQTTSFAAQSQTSSPFASQATSPFAPQSQTINPFAPQTQATSPFAPPVQTTSPFAPQPTASSPFAAPPPQASPFQAQQTSPFAPQPQQTGPFAPPPLASASTFPQQMMPQPTGFAQKAAAAQNTMAQQSNAQMAFPQAQGQSSLPQPGIQHASTFPQASPSAPGFAQAGIMPQPTGRHDKSSIMALYNFPQPAPQRQLQTLPEDSVSAPVSQLPPQSGNPFAAQQVSITAHASRESRDFQAFQQDGRHSPDAFAGLSSRFMR